MTPSSAGIADPGYGAQPDLRWSYPVDIFSIGLIILEMFLGGRMFRVRDRLQHLAAMEVALGVMPANFRSDVK